MNKLSKKKVSNTDLLIVIYTVKLLATEKRLQEVKQKLTMTRVKSLKTGGESCEETNMMLNRELTQNQRVTVKKKYVGVR